MTRGRRASREPQSETASHQYANGESDPVVQVVKKDIGRTGPLADQMDAVGADNCSAAGVLRHHQDGDYPMQPDLKAGIGQRSRAPQQQGYFPFFSSHALICAISFS